MTTTTTILESAINESIMRNHSIRVEVDDVDGAIAELLVMDDIDYAYDDGVTDVWNEDGTWRLSLVRGA